MAVTQPEPQDTGPYGDTNGTWPTPNAAFRPRPWQLIATGAIFVLVTLDVVFDGLLRTIDGDVARWLLDLGIRGHDVLGVFGHALSQAGGRGTNLIWIAIMCAVIFAQRRTLAPLVQVLSASALMFVTIYPIKEIMGRSYPADTAGDYMHAVGQYGGAFPSGHQANATLLASVGAWIAMEYIRQRWVRRIIAVYAMLAPLISAVGVLLMGYHWISDVIAGTCAGVLLLWVVRWFWASRIGQRLTEALTFQPV